MGPADADVALISRVIQPRSALRPDGSGLLCAIVAAAVLCGCATPAPASASAQRRQEVAQKGAAVMPFDLSRTSHVFDESAQGGVQLVTANDPADGRQVALIRFHLADEAGRFARGDFSGPAAIHGQDMPGLRELAAAGSKLRVTYREVPAGASITYTSVDAALVQAIHAWFEAQRADHGAHGHAHH